MRRVRYLVCCSLPRPVNSCLGAIEHCSPVCFYYVKDLPNENVKSQNRHLLLPLRAAVLHASPGTIFSRASAQFKIDVIADKSLAKHMSFFPEKKNQLFFNENMQNIQHFPEECGALRILYSHLHFESQKFCCPTKFEISN